jgi:hypothetical protein
MHTRVTYLSLHTPAALVEEVAGRSAQLPCVDLAVSKLLNPSFIPTLAGSGLTEPATLEWYGIWGDGQLLVGYGFDPAKNEYYLPAQGNYNRLGIPSFHNGQPWMVIDDSALFQITKNATYPDVFFRTRTGLAPISVKYPGDVLISFRPGYVSKGFQVPGGDDIATASFHGALLDIASYGALLTNEKDVPDAVRSDQFFELFPKAKEQMRTHKVHFIEGDKNSAVKYE